MCIRDRAYDWFGPLGRDRLDLKLSKLNQKQLRLLESDSGKEFLKHRGLYASESHSFIKGILFYPYEAWRQKIFDTTPQVNKSHLKSWWIHHCHVQNLDPIGNVWRVLPKADWLSPAIGGELFDNAELKERLNDCFRKEFRPVLLGFFDENHEESERGFVVPDDWGPSPAV